jgi:hypothetical protein
VDRGGLFLWQSLSVSVEIHLRLSESTRIHCFWVFCWQLVTLRWRCIMHSRQVQQQC